MRRDDWTVADLLARHGRICHRPPRGGRGGFLQVTFWLPWPANKEPVLRAHLEAHGIPALWRSIPGWSTPAGRTRRYARPQAVCLVRGGHAVRLLASLGWRCGNERKDRAMRLWRLESERPNLSSIAV